MQWRMRQVVLVLFPVAFLFVVFVIKVVNPELNRELTFENAIFEWIQFWSLVLGSITFGIAAILYRVHKRQDWIVPSLLFLVATYLFVALEEISWGQWVFNRELSPFFQEANIQQNITLHNLTAVQPFLHGLHILIGFSAALVCWNSRRIQSFFGDSAFSVLVPPRWLTLYFLPLALFYVFTDWISPVLSERFGIEAARVSFEFRDTFIFFADQESFEVPFILGLLFYSIMVFLKVTKSFERKLTISRVGEIFGRFFLSERAILSIFSLFLCVWYGHYFTSRPIPSVDLPSFISGVEALREQLLHGRIAFYEHETFLGWAPFLLYGIIPSLVVSILSFLVEPITMEPARLATHASLVFGVAIFPWCFYYVVKALGRAVLGDRLKERANHLVLLILVITYSFWFLNHDRQWFGIGAAAPMNIGLFSQLFAWLFMLLYFGALIRVITKQERDKRALKFLALSLGLLIPTHLLSAVYCLFIGGLAFLWYQEERKQLLLGHLIGIGVSAFWFFPFLAYVGDIAPLDIQRPKGDFLELFFRYPAWGLFQTVKTWIHSGELNALNPISIVNLLLLVLLFSHPQIKRGGLLHTLFLFVLCSLVFFSSGFIATSLQVGFHYYRFMAYVFLFTTTIFCVVPLALLARQRSKVQLTAIRGGIGLLFAACFFVTLTLPHYEREMIRENAKNNYLSQEDQVVKFFASQQKKGRVYIEYLTDYDTFPPLSAHYLASRLPKETGFEALPNSHLQEAPAYRMVAGTAKLLKAKTYNVPILFSDNADLSTKMLVKQLRDFGITHVVAGTKQFTEELLLYSKERKRIGRYTIFTLKRGGVPLAERVSGKTLVGYHDEHGTAPFRLVQYYFYSRQFLYRNFELLDLKGKERKPDQIGIILRNAKNGADRTGKPGTLLMDFFPEYRLDHYSPHYPHNTELDAYRAIEEYFEKTFKLKEKLKAFRSRRKKEAVSPITATWTNEGQGLSLGRLQSDVLYRINYSYLPLWRANSAELYRGMGERMYLLPGKEEVELSFSRWNSASSWVGMLVSLLSLLLIFTPVFPRLAK